MLGSWQPKRTGLMVTAAIVLVVACLSPALAETLTDAAEHYRPLMAEQIDQSLAGARLLRERIAAGDLEGAKTALTRQRSLDLAGIRDADVSRS